MKSCYHIKLSPTAIAIADLVDYYGRGRIITRINVPVAHRGQGYATKLLNLITDDADNEGVTLFLEISPSDGLGYYQLLGMYKRHGFQEWNGIFRRRSIK